MAAGLGRGGDDRVGVAGLLAELEPETAFGLLAATLDNILTERERDELMEELERNRRIGFHTLIQTPPAA
jgi:hypothetical protein